MGAAVASERLLPAAARGDVSMCEKLLRDHGADVNFVSPSASGDNKTALFQAAEANYARVVELLLRAGADSGIATVTMSWTPLHCASRKGRVRIVKMLCEHGANTQVVDKFGFTPVSLACIAQTDSEPTARALLEYGCPLKVACGDGRTALHLAVSVHNTATVRLLLDQPTSAGGGAALVDRQDQKGRTALHIAASLGFDDIVQVLIDEGGANVFARTEEGRAPVDLARGDSLKLLAARMAVLDDTKNDAIEFARCRGSDGRTLLERFVERDDLLLCERALEHVPIFDAAVDAAFKVALEQKNEAIVGLLRAHGALDPTHEPGAAAMAALRAGTLQEVPTDRDVLLYRDAQGASLAHHAAALSHVPMLEALVAACPALATCATLTDGCVPVHYLVRQPALTQLPDCLAHTIGKRNARGRTALHVAASHGNTAIVRRLLELDPGCQDAVCAVQRRTPLHYAALNGHEDVVRVLIVVAEADVNARDAVAGATPLHLAATVGHAAVCELLIHHGARLDIRTWVHKTPAEVAHDSVATMLAQARIHAPPVGKKTVGEKAEDIIAHLTGLLAKVEGASEQLRSLAEEQCKDEAAMWASVRDMSFLQAEAHRGSAMATAAKIDTVIDGATGAAALIQQAAKPWLARADIVDITERAAAGVEAAKAEFDMIAAQRSERLAKRQAVLENL